MLPGREELGSSIVLRRRERNPGLSITTVGTLSPNNSFLEVDNSSWVPTPIRMILVPTRQCRHQSPSGRRVVFKCMEVMPPISVSQFWITVKPTIYWAVCQAKAFPCNTASCPMLTVMIPKTEAVPTSFLVPCGLGYYGCSLVHASHHLWPPRHREKAKY